MAVVKREKIQYTYYISNHSVDLFISNGKEKLVLYRLGDRAVRNSEPVFEIHPTGLIVATKLLITDGKERRER